MTELTILDHDSDPHFEDLEILSLKEKMRLSQFQNKQRLIQMQCQIEVYKIRAQQYRSRYEELVSSRGDEQVTELLKKLKDKENQILEVRSKEIQNKTRLATRYKDMQLRSNQKMEVQLSKMIQENKQLNEKIEEIKDRAVQALVQKQNIIDSLNEKLQSTANVEESLEYLELKDQYQSLLEKSQAELKEYEIKLQQKKLQNSHLIERIQKDSALYQQRLIKLQYDLQERMNGNIKEALTVFQANQSNLLNDLENLQSTIQKFELKSNQLQIQNEKLKSQIQFQRKRATAQIQSATNTNNEQIAKTYKHFEEIIKAKEKQISQLVALNQKFRSDLRKKALQEVEERKNFMNNMKTNRKLSQSSLYKYGDANKSFESEDQVRKSKPDDEQKISARINQLKELEENYEWPSIHKPGQISEFDPHLKQSVESIEAIQQCLNNPKVAEPDEVIEPTQTLENPKSTSVVIERDDEELSKLKAELEESYTTITDLNNKISQLTKELQDNRQLIVQLKKQKQPPKNEKEAQLRSQLDNIKLYLCELQKQLLSQKWKYTQLVEYLRSEVQVRQAEYMEQMAKASLKRRSKV